MIDSPSVGAEQQTAGIPAKPPPEFTLRAVLAGCVIGGLLAVEGVYMGLKTGWGDTGNITSAVLGAAFFAAFWRRTLVPYSALENNITQTVAASAAVMPFALGLV